MPRAEWPASGFRFLKIRAAHGERIFSGPLAENTRPEMPHRHMKRTCPPASNNECRGDDGKVPAHVNRGERASILDSILVAPKVVASTPVSSTARGARCAPGGERSSRDLSLRGACKSDLINYTLRRLEGQIGGIDFTGASGVNGGLDPVRRGRSNFTGRRPGEGLLRHASQKGADPASLVERGWQRWIVLLLSPGKLPPLQPFIFARMGNA